MDDDDGETASCRSSQYEIDLDENVPSPVSFHTTVANEDDDSPRRPCRPSTRMLHTTRSSLDDAIAMDSVCDGHDDVYVDEASDLLASGTSSDGYSVDGRHVEGRSGKRPSPSSPVRPISKRQKAPAPTDLVTLSSSDHPEALTSPLRLRKDDSSEQGGTPEKVARQGSVQCNISDEDRSDESVYDDNAGEEEDEDGIDEMLPEFWIAFWSQPVTPLQRTAKLYTGIHHHNEGRPVVFAGSGVVSGELLMRYMGVDDNVP